ncbi:MAG: GNAT family N-acetyltransferase [Actinomycetota bacterium]
MEKPFDGVYPERSRGTQDRLDIVELKQLDLSLLRELARFEEEAYEVGGFNEWSLVIFVRNGRLLILKKEGEIVGTAELIKDWDSGKAYLAGFAIKREERGKSVGSYFLGEILRRLKNAGFPGVELTVSSKNIAALRLYQKFGFIKTSFVKDMYGEGEDRLILELDFRKTPK